MSPEAKKRGGAIVNMASGCSFAAELNMVAYNASKHGVMGVTKSAALEYATSGIRVNAVCPGVIRTELAAETFKTHPEAEARYAATIPIQRMGKPEEIAKVVLWLCTDAASYIAGHGLIVDGGLLVKV